MPRQRRPTRAVIEAVLAFLLGSLLTLVARRPQDLATTVPGDAGDPVLLAWIVSWPGHAVASGKALFDANAFAPLPNSLAFSDPMLGYLPFSLIGEGPSAALVRYNLVLLFTYALAFAGTWVLVRQLGLGRAAALVAATAFAFSPWRAAMASHLQVLSSGGVPLALAMLARGHGIGARVGSRPIRPGWIVAGWATAAWHFSLSPSLGLQLAYLLAVCTGLAGLHVLLRVVRGNPWPARRLLAADAVGLVLFLGVSGVIAQPFLQAVEDHPEARRSVADVALFSPSIEGLLTAPPSSWAWGRVTEERREGVVAFNEEALFPGLAVTLLAAVGLLRGPWSLRRRLLLLGATVVVAAFALGTEGPFGGRLGYLLLYDYAPGWQGVRTPGRLVNTAWLGLGLLAAHGVHVLRAAAAARAPREAAAERSAALVLGLGLSAVVFLEGLDTQPLAPVQVTPPVALADLPEPLLVLPSEAQLDYRVMLWSTDGFPRIVNGSSGFTPTRQEELRTAAAALPDLAALERLRAAGIRSLLLLPGELQGTRYERLDVPSLSALPGVTVEDRGEAVVVLLR